MYLSRMDPRRTRTPENPLFCGFECSMFFTILPEVKNMLSSDTHVSVSAPANTQTNEGGKKNANVWQTYQRLLEGVEAVANSDTWKDFLGFLTKFSLRKYSFRNILLIYRQMPTASLVAGFRTWKKHGRVVKRGERGIAIFAPVIIRVPKAEYRVGRNSEASEQDADALPEPEKEEALVGYRIVHVFDISQTEGKPLAVPEIDMHVPENQNASVLLQFSCVGEPRDWCSYLRLRNAATHRNPRADTITAIGESSGVGLLSGYMS